MKDRNETLTAMFPPCSTTYSLANTAWNAANGYQALGTNILYYTGNIDLSGYSMMDMTFATFETAYQDPGIYSNTNPAGVAAGAFEKIEIIEMITDVPFDIAELTILAADMGSTVPGMLSTKQDFKQIIYGRYSLYVPNSTLGLAGYMQLVNAGGFGSKEPTAAAKLYVYKLVKATTNLVPEDGENISFPASRCGLNGRMFSEDEIPYLMRLKRSYELQQLVD